MTADEVNIKVTEIDQRAKSNTRRIDKLEQSTDALHELTISVKEMVLKQDYVADTVNKLDKKVEDLEKKPVRRWEGVVDKILFAIVGGVAAFLLMQIGIG